MSTWSDLAEDLLPPLLQDFVRLIGVTATMLLVERFGGLRIYIPARPNADHHLAQLIGLDALQKLSEVYGLETHFQLPKAMHALLAIRDRKIIAEYGPKSIRQLAAEHHLTERHVTRIVAAAHSSNPDQTELFG